MLKAEHRIPCFPRVIGSNPSHRAGAVPQSHFKKWSGAADAAPLRLEYSYIASEFTSRSVRNYLTMFMVTLAVLAGSGTSALSITTVPATMSASIAS